MRYPTMGPDSLIWASKAQPYEHDNKDAQMNALACLPYITVDVAETRRWIDR